MGKNSIKNENYYVVQGWMRSELGLSGNALSIYAIIYGFSQISHQEFTASISYLGEWLGVSRPTVINTLKDLVDKGYLTKESEEKNNIIYNRYTAVAPNFTSSKNFLLGSKISLPQSSKEILPNNINNNTEDKKKESKRDPEESFNGIINSSVENPVIKDALVDFIKMRKLIKKPLTNRALKNIISKLKKLAGEDAILATAILDQSITNGWQDVYQLKEDYGPRSTKKSTAVSKKFSGNTLKDAEGKDIVFK